VYGESACPDTKVFVVGPLASAAAIFGDRVSIGYVPFGNAYYSAVPSPANCSSSAACLFNATTRDCYFATCGKGSPAPRPSSCFAGSPRCQHGRAECFANRIQASTVVMNRFHCGSFYRQWVS